MPAPQPRTPYPAAVLVTVAALGVLLGLLVWYGPGREITSETTSVTRTVGTKPATTEARSRPEAETTVERPAERSGRTESQQEQRSSAAPTEKDCNTQLPDGTYYVCPDEPTAGGKIE